MFFHTHVPNVKLVLSFSAPGWGWSAFPCWPGGGSNMEGNRLWEHGRCTLQNIGFMLTPFHTNLKSWEEGYSVVNAEKCVVFFSCDFRHQLASLKHPLEHLAFLRELQRVHRRWASLDWTCTLWMPLFFIVFNGPWIQVLAFGRFLLNWCAILCEGWKLLERSCFKTFMNLDRKKVDSEIRTIQWAISWRKEVPQGWCTATPYASGPLF